MKIEVSTCGDCPFYDEVQQCCRHPLMIGKNFRGCDEDDCPDFCPLRGEDVTITFGAVEGDNPPRWVNGSLK